MNDKMDIGFICYKYHCYKSHQDCGTGTLFQFYPDDEWDKKTYTLQQALETYPIDKYEWINLEYNTPPRTITQKNAQTVQSNIYFEVGKYYKHPCGRVIHIIGAAPTTLYGWTLIAEEHASANLIPIGQGDKHSDHWQETTEDHWLSAFSK